ncbi:MAG: RluA family pseudouridine synthase [Clostridium sp.]|uniref:RluA family pseudouridine synthase n=1 Tax=Clostridium sp. TaxID=1506 RepID=UPI002FC67A81
MSTLEKSVSSKYDGLKIKFYLKDELELSSRLIKRASKEQRIFVNNKAIRMDYIIKAGDNVKVQLDREESQDIAPEKMDLDIVYEDEDILVINKNPYIVVHPTKNYQSGTLANGVINYFNETGQNHIVRLVSRLDMNTSGLIVIAKNQYAHMVLQKEDINKRYIAIVHGNLEKKEGTIDLPIYRPQPGDGFDSIKRVVDDRGQRSVTHYKVLESFKGGDVVECLLETGRTHQIRVHLSHLGHPIYGDFIYGNGDEEMDLIKRQALHAYGLNFKSPRHDEELSLRANLPDDFKSLIEKIK